MPAIQYVVEGLANGSFEWGWVLLVVFELAQPALAGKKSAGYRENYRALGLTSERQLSARARDKASYHTVRSALDAITFNIAVEKLEAKQKRPSNIARYTHKTLKEL